MRYDTWTQLLDERCDILGMSRREASLSMGFAASYLEAVEKKRLRPSPERCLKMAEFFEIDANDVLALAQLYIPPTTEEVPPLAKEITREITTLPLMTQRVLHQIVLGLKHRQRLVAEQKPIYHAQRNEHTIIIELPVGVDSEKIFKLLQEFLDQLQ